MGRVVLFLVAILLVLRWPASVDAQIYRWVDENGVPHFAHGIESVPGPYRSKAVPLGMKNAPAPPAAPPGAAAPKTPPAEATNRFTPGQRILVDVRVRRNAEAKPTL